MAENVNDWPAGNYELLAREWTRDTQTEPGKPMRGKRYTRGEIIELDEHDASRLGQARLIARPGERERQDAERLQAQLRQAQTAAEAAKTRAEQATSSAEGARSREPAKGRTVGQ